MTTYRGPSVEEITHRAYGLYLERGGDHGNDVDDWVRAENELGEESDAGQAKTADKQATSISSNKIYLGQYQSRRRDCFD
jgi:Protein of unknown function (DUF2934)